MTAVSNVESLLDPKPRVLLDSGARSLHITWQGPAHAPPAEPARAPPDPRLVRRCPTGRRTMRPGGWHCSTRAWTCLRAHCTWRAAPSMWTARGACPRPIRVPHRSASLCRPPGPACSCHAGRNSHGALSHGCVGACLRPLNHPGAASPLAARARSPRSGREPTSAACPVRRWMDACAHESCACCGAGWMLAARSGGWARAAQDADRDRGDAVAPVAQPAPDARADRGRAERDAGPGQGHLAAQGHGRRRRGAAPLWSFALPLYTDKCRGLLCF